MKVGCSGSALLLLGGILVAASGFSPPGHERTHWVVFSEALDSLLYPDSDLPFSWRRPLFYAAEVVGLGYPALCGLAFAAAAGLGRSRAAGGVMLLVHTLCCLFLAAAAVAVATPESGGARSDVGATAGLLGGALLLGTLLLFEALLLLRGLKQLYPDRVNFPPAVLLLGLYATLYVVFFRNPHWPVMGYLVGFVGAGLATIGMVVRKSSLR